MAEAEYTIDAKDSVNNSIGIMLSRGPKNIQTSYQNAIQHLEEYPTTGSNVTLLKGSKFYRYRCSTWRIIYQVDNNEMEVQLIAVGPRATIYKTIGYDIDNKRFYNSTLANSETDIYKDKVPTPIERAKYANDAINEDHKEVFTEKSPIPDYILRLIDPELLNSYELSKEEIHEISFCSTMGELVIAISKIKSSKEGAKIMQDILPKPLSSIAQEKVRTDLSKQDLMEILNQEGVNFDQFNLKLDPNQKKFVRRFKNKKNLPKGPYQIKGSPGSGKSTVMINALYEIIKNIDLNGPVRVLFVAYTKALIAISKKLIGLLGAKIDPVIINIDQILKEEKRNQKYRKNTIDYIKGGEAKKTEFLRKSVNSTFKNTSLIEQGVITDDTGEQINKYNADSSFIYKEIEDIILGRNIDSLVSYINADRAGRKRPLNKNQRTIIWEIWKNIEVQLNDEDLSLIPQEYRDLMISPLVEYDFIFIDEAQDLYPTGISMLLNKCDNPENCFISIDPNQSLFRAPFKWKDVKHNHKPINFSGKTTILKQNHRTTQQIWDAALNLIISSEDSDVDTSIEANYPKRKGNMPIIADLDIEDQFRYLETWIYQNMLEESVTLNACVVLVPTWEVGNLFEKRIRPVFNPKFFSSRYLADNLDHLGLLITTFDAAKGFGWPVTVIAGLGSVEHNKSIDYKVEGIGFPYPRALRQDFDHTKHLYTAMTRAGNSLLILNNKSHPCEYLDPIKDYMDIPDDNWYKDLI